MILHAYPHPLLGTFGNPGNGPSREELRRAKTAIQEDSTAHDVPEERPLLRLDGHDGTRAVIGELADISSVTCSKDDTLLDRADSRPACICPPMST
jgi:hypothetical protein